MIILGSTGSIGQNTLLLAKQFNLDVFALACEKNYKLLNKQIELFKPKFVYIKDKNLAKFVKSKNVFSGDISLFLKACHEEFGSIKLINALVGISGLKPSKIAQELSFKLCLANKESLVAGGKFLNCDLIEPIDSEHFGLKFLLKTNPKIKKLIITASGGAVYKTPTSSLNLLTPKKVLKHPNWDMGAKITIDSSTMANKLFEVLEAYWLYKVKNIDAFIERSSILHALIDFEDGSSTAHFSQTDMRLAIAHALGLNDNKIIKNINLQGKNFKLESINLKKYPIFSLKNEVLKNTDLGVIINAANEFGVKSFLNKKCKFKSISKMIFKSLDKFGDKKINDFESIFELNNKVIDFLK